MGTLWTLFHNMRKFMHLRNPRCIYVEMLIFGQKWVASLKCTQSVQIAFIDVQTMYILGVDRFGTLCEFNFKIS